MSQSPFANQHSAEAALATAVLFVWMKFWQALFARRIRAQLAADPMPRWNARESLRIVLLQAIIQPTGLFIIPLAVVLVVPFGRVYALYQSVTALEDAGSYVRSRLVRRAWKQASTWVWHIPVV